MEREDAIAVLLRRPGRTGIFCDFDGTLAEIVDRPEDAKPVPGAVAALTSLARLFPAVAVVSGRSLEDLRTRFAPKGVALLGSYGRERSDRHRPRMMSGGWEAVSVAAVSRVRELAGVVVEPKGAGVALHYRKAPDRGEEVRRIACELAGEFELEVRPGKLVAELIVPGPGKAEAVADLVTDYGLDACLYAGDDVADLEVFERARELGVMSILVGVASDEAPAGLLRRSNIVVQGPKDLVELLWELARRAAA